MTRPRRGWCRVGGRFSLRQVHPVHHSSANGVPLGVEASERGFKVLCLDVGLMSTVCGLSVLDLERADDLLLVNRGALAEQMVGQHLLHSAPSWEPPRLFYWAESSAAQPPRSTT